jgi:hypothetical protein
MLGLRTSCFGNALKSLDITLLVKHWANFLVYLEALLESIKARPEGVTLLGGVLLAEGLTACAQAVSKCCCSR